MLPPRPQSSSPNGFALVIALSLMAFIVLLLLAMSTLVRVESESSSLSLKKLEARQNALLGAYVALGELQKYTGPDQRATASARIFDGSADGAAHWTGVWGNGANPQVGLTDAPVLLQWLVSGNEAQNFSPASSVDLTEGAFGRITVSPAVPPLRPDTVATDFDYGSPSTATVDSAPAVLLVGAATVDPSAPEDAVVAPLVAVESEAGDTVGRYAWWVGDESVKVRFNLTDPFVVPSPAMQAAGATPDPGNLGRVALPQTPGLRAVSDFAAMPEDDLAVKKSNSLDEIPLLYGDTIVPEAALPEHFHAVGGLSRTVLADSKRGGLKADLTYLSAGSVDDFIDALINPTAQAPDYNPILPEAVLPRSAGGPTWEQLHGFLNLRYDGSTAVASRAQDATTHGIAPIVTLAKLFIGGTRGANGNFHLYLFPSFVIGNPYDVPIAAENFRIRLELDSTDAVVEAFYGRDIPGGSGPADKVDFDNNAPIYTADLKGILDEVVFELLLTEDLAAGEGRIFTPDVDASGEFALGGSASVVPMANEWDNAFGALALDTGIPLSDDDLLDDPAIEDDTDILGVFTWVRGGGSVLDVELAREDGSVLQRVAGIDMASVGISGQKRRLISSESSTAVVMPAPGTGLKRVQGGVFLKLLDGAHSLPFASNYLGVADVRRPVFPIYNIRAPFIADLVHYDSAGASGPDPFVLYGHNTWDGYVQSFIDRNDSYLLDPADPTVGILRWAGSLDRDTEPFFSQFDYAPFHVLRGAVPTASIGDLRHFNAGGHPDGGYDTDYAPLYVTPSYTIGNSRAHPLITRDSVSESLAGQTYYDLSYLLNRELSDRFFFSTYPQDVAVPGDADMRLVNSRLRPATGSVTLADDTEFRESGAGGGGYARGDERKAAEHLLLEGGFNVNSASVEAWVAILSSLQGVEFKGVDTWEGLFPASITPLEGPGDGADLTAVENWTGFRNLTLAQIETLAAAIVDQVKVRGPFLSLADFINRELDSGDTGLRGALEAAIRNAGLNGNLPAEMEVWPSGTASTVPNDLPGGLFTDAAHLPESLFEGIPAWLSQADLLRPLLPVATTRGDTFRIRAYGEVLDPIGQEVASRVWCEMTVQRMPEYAGEGDAATLNPADASEVSQAFGRRFEIIKVRWLESDEV